MDSMSKRGKIKKATILLFTLFLSGSAYALSAVTVENYVACLKKEWLDDMTAFAAKNDQTSFQAYLDTNKCLMLKKDLPVTVTQSPGLLGTQTEFVYEGVKFWTVREALIDFKP